MVSSDWISRNKKKFEFESTKLRSLLAAMCGVSRIFYSSGEVVVRENCWFDSLLLPLSMHTLGKRAQCAKGSKKFQKNDPKVCPINCRVIYRIRCISSAGVICHKGLFAASLKWERNLFKSVTYFLISQVKKRQGTDSQLRNFLKHSSELQKTPGM